MSIRANPTMIGLFMICALVMAVVGVGVLASSSWFEDRTTFVSFFQESVNGLEQGAPVKFQGAPIGSVGKILIQIDERDRTFQVTVRYDIDLKSFTSKKGIFLHLDQESVLEDQIANGLRAQLQMESIVTGQLYIELGFDLEAPPPEFIGRTTVYPEIPTTPSLFSTLGTSAGTLVTDILKVLYQVNEMLADVDTKEINAAVVASARAVQRLVESPEILAAIGQVHGMTAQVTGTMAELEILTRRAGAAVDSLELRLDGTSTDVALTLQSLRRTLDEAHAFLSTDSGFGIGLEQALISFRDAAEALRVLAITLERNPDMLIRGKKPPE